MNKLRVRYGRVGSTRIPKNTLVTKRDGDVIYFGIARCNKKLDIFHKNIGVNIARGRVEVVMGDISNSVEYSSFNEFILHKSGLRGWVRLENIKKLVEYFRNIDEHCSRTISKG